MKQLGKNALDDFSTTDERRHRKEHRSLKGRARHSVRAVTWHFKSGAHGVTRPTGKMQIWIYLGSFVIFLKDALQSVKRR